MSVLQDCRSCEGGGVFLIPTCKGGSDHAGFNCHGTVCGYDEVPCEACDGTGHVPSEGEE